MTSAKIRHWEQLEIFCNFLAICLAVKKTIVFFFRTAVIYGCSFFQLRFSPENFLFSALFILPLCSIYSFHSKQAFSCSPLFCFFFSPICSLVYFFTPNVSFPCCCSFCMWRHINFALAGWARNKIDVKGPKIWKEGHKSENYHLAGFNLNSVFFCPQVNCSSWVGIPETPWGGGVDPLPMFSRANF